jgi:hypothetical protein
LLERAFSHFWLLLNLTGANWGPLEIKKRQDRQTDRKWDQVCWVLRWRHTTLIASFLCLYSFRSCSLHFFKTLPLKPSLKPCLKPLFRLAPSCVFC